MNQLDGTSIVKISQNELNSGNFADKLNKAKQAGFFYVEMPEACKRLQQFAVEYADKFFTIPAIRELKLDMPSGFSVPKDTQNERLILEDKYWEQYLSDEIILMGKKMHELGVKILQETLKAEHVEEKDWDLATGGAANNRGKTFLTFNRYNPEEQRIGLKPHRDFGEITILFINQKGLQVKIDDEYVDVDPMENHLIVNFGRALETYFNDREKLTAAWHRVQQVAQNRISIGLFMDSDFDAPVYKREGSNNLMVESTFGAYLLRLFKEIVD